MHLTVKLALLLLAHATPSWSKGKWKTLSKPCPDVYILAARETREPGQPRGYGKTGEMVNRIEHWRGVTKSEFVDYPACTDGRLDCGGYTYEESMELGMRAAGVTLNKFVQRCPDAYIVLLGYEQGAHALENALCGGGDPDMGIMHKNPTIPFTATNRIAGAVFMGNPRWEYSAFYNVGTCMDKGWDPRPVGWQCLHSDVIQSYCDAEDAICCNGTSNEHHGQYVPYYSKEVLAFLEFAMDKLWKDPYLQNDCCPR